MNDPQQCSLCEEAWATTSWGFPVCQPCHDFLAALDVELQAMEAADPGLAALRPFSHPTSYRDRARKAIAERRAAEPAS